MKTEILLYTLLFVALVQSVLVIGLMRFRFSLLMGPGCRVEPNRLTKKLNDGFPRRKCYVASLSTER